MLKLYNQFTEPIVGSAQRTLKNFSRMLQRKDNIVYVALDGQSRIIGYVGARFEKTQRRGLFLEIVVDPAHDFERVSKPLVKKVNEVFAEKKASMIFAGSTQNPLYGKLFSSMGFFESESTDVFMYAILDVPKFLDEFSPVLINRLERVKGWMGVAQLECDGHSLFLEKTRKGVQRIVWTNERVDFKLAFTKEMLTKLIFGVADAVEARKAGLLTVDVADGSGNGDRLLGALFPGKRFLIMDYW
jgi:N-acetylglutamate synthase-like GNAT family acetyltransferase